MKLADEAGLLGEIMTYLVDNQVIANMNDLWWIQAGGKSETSKDPQSRKSVDLLSNKPT